MEASRASVPLQQGLRLIHAMLLRIGAVLHAIRVYIQEHTFQKADISAYIYFIFTGLNFFHELQGIIITINTNEGLKYFTVCGMNLYTV